MNAQARYILELGIFFAAAVIILDTFLIQIPILDWLALGLAFFFIAALILGSIAREIPWHAHRAISIPETENELEYLTHVIDASVYRGDTTTSRLLSDEIKSIVLGAIAVRTNLPKKEVLELAENQPDSLRAMVRDGWVMKFLESHPSLEANLTEEELEQTLSEIDSWSQ